ncbi:MAG: DUF4037 domain-containing protein [Chloroflexota bacterium]|nr:DUF4037 domain-containing protein [Chloroflexota bacterium]
MQKFIPGLKLCEYFFEEAIQPIMLERFPNLAYSAARLEWGSDVIGFDTPMSMDHGWGPKLTVFLRPQDYEDLHQQLDITFANHLPFQIHGFPTNFDEPLSDGGVMNYKENYPIHHMVTITTPEKFFADYLGVDIQNPLSPTTWLTLPQQRLRTLRAGCIYHDGLESLVELRGKFNWYPQDLWLYLMANQWRRIDQEEAFIGRTGSVGDELGSRLIAASLIRDMMHLALLMTKQFSPYTKWFGTAFGKLELAEELTPLFLSALNSQEWEERESQISKAYILLAEAHNKLSITPKISPKVSDFHGRPFQVPHSSRFVEALLSQIQDPSVKALPPDLGSVDQVVNNVDVLEHPTRCKKLGVLFDQPDQ